MCKRSCIAFLASALVFLVMATPPQSPARETPSGNEVQVEMQNVVYHYTNDVFAHIVQLRGKLIPAKPGQMAVFDDKSSFTLSISSAEISITTESLARILNDYVFQGSDAPVKNVSIRASGNTLLMEGKLHQKGDIPFESSATITPTPDGQIRVHTYKLKAVHLPIKGLLDVLGLKLASLINMKTVMGVTADGNDLILDPRLIFPPPHIAGFITAVRIDGNDIVQTFGKADPEHKFQSGNYMAYRGNQLRFGKLTMNDTDLTLIDMDSGNPFDFYLDRYRDQLVAGYTKTTRTFGLRVFMKDFNQLNRSPTEATAGVRPAAMRNAQRHYSARLKAHSVPLK